MRKRMMSDERGLALVWLLVTGSFCILSGVALASTGADDQLETLVTRVEALATDKGGELRSVHQNDSHSSSVTAIMRSDQLGQLQELLSDAHPGVMVEYVHSPSNEYRDYLRVGVDLMMTSEQYSSAWWRSFTSLSNMSIMALVFLSIWVALLAAHLLFRSSSVGSASHSEAMSL